jgi:hypothetical protein
MNAGAEYVLYRIWATLQDRDGIHVESLLSCIGALAGYACQAAAARAGADPGKYLFESPLSVCSLVGRAVQKLGKPLPDIAGISGQTVVLISDEHRPRLTATVYVKQLWPQVLPIARRFCRKPIELPVLFGIALQRAVEHTTERLSPTLGAGIAMESAVAMSKIAPLPEAPLDTVPSLWATSQVTASPKKTTAPSLPEIRADFGTTRSTHAKRKNRNAVPSTPQISSFAARLPSLKIAATVASLAIITLGVIWQAERGEAPEPTRVVRQLKVSTSPTPPMDEPAPEQPVVEPQVDEPLPPPPPVYEEPPPPPPEMESTMPIVPEPYPNEGIISEERPPA